MSSSTKLADGGFNLSNVLGSVTDFTKNAGNIAGSISSIFEGAQAGSQQAQTQVQQQLPIIQVQTPAQQEYEGFEKYLTPTNLIIGGVGIGLILLLTKHK